MKNTPYDLMPITYFRFYYHTDKIIAYFNICLKNYYFRSSIDCKRQKAFAVCNSLFLITKTLTFQSIINQTRKNTLFEVSVGAKIMPFHVGRNTELSRKSFQVLVIGHHEGDGVIFGALSIQAHIVNQWTQLKCCLDLAQRNIFTMLQLDEVLLAICSIIRQDRHTCA